MKNCFPHARASVLIFSFVLSVIRFPITSYSRCALNSSSRCQLSINAHNAGWRSSLALPISACRSSNPNTRIVVGPKTDVTG